MEARANVREWKWENIIFLGSTPILALILVPWYLLTQPLSWSLVILIAVLCVLTSMSITLGYHRLLAHRTFEARTWVQVLVLYFGAGAFQGSALQWCSDHRRHHRFEDKEADPYNIHRGFWWAHMGWLFFEDPPELRNQFAPDLKKNRLVMFQYHYYVPLAVWVGFLMPWLLGYFIGAPMGGLILAGLGRLIFTQHCTFLINSACHYFGRRPYSLDVSARDSLLLAIFTYGEGWHNYHHSFQSDYRNGVHWYQWDPTKWAIRALAWTGNAWKLKRMQAPEILRARMGTEEQRLLSRGIPAERLKALKARVEEAQIRVRQLHDDYKKLKASVSASSRGQLINLRAELKLARMEFRLAFDQWRMYYKTMRALPIAS